MPKRRERERESERKRRTEVTRDSGFERSEKVVGRSRGFAGLQSS